MAAGAAHTPALLLRSGVTLGGRVGGTFFAHLGAGLMAIMDEVVDPWVGATQGYGAFSPQIPGMKYECLWAPPSLILVRWGEVGLPFLEALPELKHAAVLAVVYRGKVDGRVRLGLGGGPRLSLRVPDAEAATVVRGMKIGADALFAVGARRIHTGIFGVKTLERPADTAAMLDRRASARDLPMTANHIFGSCPMSPDPRRGVTDLEGRVHGIEGLYIADASLFPSPSAVNPQATIMALADRVSRRIGERSTAA
jgi:hypothetical protein